MEQALAALFDEQHDRRGRNEIADHAAMYWMATKMVKDRLSSWRAKTASKKDKPREAARGRSIRSLPKKAAEAIYGNSRDPNAIDAASARLGAKWAGKNSYKQNGEYWLAMVRRDNDVTETEETQILESILGGTRQSWRSDSPKSTRRSAALGQIRTIGDIRSPPGVSHVRALGQRNRSASAVLRTHVAQFHRGGMQRGAQPGVFLTAARLNKPNSTR